MLFKPFLAALAVLSSPSAAQNAFSGAVGFGAISIGGNGGTTVHVTNLNDSGAGSFRDAVSASNRIIVFDVSGYIVLKSAISLSSHLTINGQTAPAPGIGIMGGEISASGKTDIVIRNMRMRQGNMDSDTGKSAFNAGDASNVILDHCSIEFGQWDSVDVVSTANFTLSNSIIALPIGQQFGCHLEGGPATFYRNLWVSAHNRQPLAKSNTQYINNVVYNYQAAYTVANTGGDFEHDLIGNYFIAGPSTTSSSNALYQMDANQQVYLSGNLLDANEDGVLNGAAISSAGSAKLLSQSWAETSQSLAGSLAAADAYAYVVANAGASPRDQVDAYVVAQVQSLGKSGAIITNQASTGLANDGYGTL